VLPIQTIKAGLESKQANPVSAVVSALPARFEPFKSNVQCV
jgi:hypothetical protein